MNSTLREVAVPRQAARPRFRLQTFASLKYRDYRFLWISTLFSSNGQWIQQVTLGWLVYQMTGSYLLLGLVNGMRAIPFFFLGPIAGVVADRVDRRRLMMVSQGLMAVGIFLFALDVALGFVQVWHVFAFSLMTGVGWSFAMPVRQALVPSLVPKDDLMNAIALNSAGFNLTRMIGPTMGGLLIAVIGVAGNFFLESVMYSCVVVMVFLMRVPPQTYATAGSWKSNMAEGFQYVWNDKMVLTLILMALIPITFSMPYVSLMPGFAVEVLHQGAGGYGLLLAVSGFGAMTGTLILASLSNFQKRGALLLASIIVVGFGLMAFAWTTSLPLALALLFGIGMAQISFMATNNTLLQTIVPDHLRGRVFALYNLDMGLVPIGTALAGALADGTNVHVAITVMGAVCAVLGILSAVTLRHVRRLA